MKNNEILIILTLFLASLLTLVLGYLQFKTAKKSKSALRYMLAVLLLLLFLIIFISLLKFTTPGGVEVAALIR